MLHSLLPKVCTSFAGRGGCFNGIVLSRKDTHGVILYVLRFRVVSEVKRGVGNKLGSNEGNLSCNYIFRYWYSLVHSNVYLFINVVVIVVILCSDPLYSMSSFVFVFVFVRSKKLRLTTVGDPPR
jgi:hypothetical protein